MYEKKNKAFGITRNCAISTDITTYSSHDTKSIAFKFEHSDELTRIMNYNDESYRAINVNDLETPKISGNIQIVKEESVDLRENEGNITVDSPVFKSCGYSWQRSQYFTEENTGCRNDGPFDTESRAGYSDLTTDRRHDDAVIKPSCPTEFKQDDTESEMIITDVVKTESHIVEDEEGIAQVAVIHFVFETESSSRDGFSDSSDENPTNGEIVYPPSEVKTEQPISEPQDSLRGPDRPRNEIIYVHCPVKLTEKAAMQRDVSDSKRDFSRNPASCEQTQKDIRSPTTFERKLNSGREQTEREETGKCAPQTEFEQINKGKRSECDLTRKSKRRRRELQRACRNPTASQRTQEASQEQPSKSEEKRTENGQQKTQIETSRFLEPRKTASAEKHSKGTEAGGESLEIIYSCPVCGQEFGTKYRLRRHMVSHETTKPFKCQECGKGFVSGSSLKTHQAVHSHSKPYSCKLCHMGFVSAKTLQKHKITHSGEQPFPCETCGKRFSRKANLSRHMVLHSNVKSHQCEICSKQFFSLAARDLHVDSIHGKKLFECSECGKKFGAKGRLTAHFVKHSLPYSCHICDKRLPNKSALEAHLPRHSKVKAGWNCDKCSLQFSRSRMYREHMKTVHTKYVST